MSARMGLWLAVLPLLAGCEAKYEVKVGQPTAAKPAPAESKGDQAQDGPKLDKLATSDTRDEKSHDVTDEKTTITPDTTELYATANLSGLKPGSKVTGAIHAVDVVTAKGEHIKDTSVASTDVDVSDDVDKAGGKLTTNFKFTGPDAGWPVGTYAVKVAVDGHEVGTQELTVAKAEPADSK